MSFSCPRAADIDTSLAVVRWISCGDELAPEDSAGGTGIKFPVGLFL